MTTLLINNKASKKNVMSTSDFFFVGRTKQNRLPILGHGHAYLHSLDAKPVHSHSTVATNINCITPSNDDCSTTASSASQDSVYFQEHEQPCPALRRRSVLRFHDNWRNQPRHALAQKNVKFSLAVTQQWHLALYEYTTDELDACWFRADEYAEIACSCRKEIKMLEQGGSTMKNFIEDNCPRGLESHTYLASIARSQNRLAARKTVFDEQSDQLALGVIDDEAIASRYHDASCSSNLWAICVGQQDKKQAELVYDFMLLQNLLSKKHCDD
jgi:hypothetical protein